MWPFSPKASSQIDSNQHETTHPATKLTTVLVLFMITRQCNNLVLDRGKGGSIFWYQL